MPDPEEPTLFRSTSESRGGSFEAHALEQYKLYVQSAENVSSRRIASIRYMLTMSTALVAVYGVQSATFGQGLWLLPIPVVGVASGLAWHQIITSYKNLNALKFDVIHEFEQHLPAAPFTYEWSNHGGVYTPVTELERLLPAGFIALHVLFIVMIVLAACDVFDWTA